jgi:hypothetical protein
VKYQVEEYECALSGLMADAVPEFKEDGLEGLPPGWTEVTFKQRRVNPNFILIQQVKAALIEATLQQVPEEHREMQRVPVQVQIAAQFAQLEVNTPPYVMEEDVVHLAPPSMNKAVGTAINEVREALGIETYEDEDEGDEEEAEQEEQETEVSLTPPAPGLGQSQSA